MNRTIRSILFDLRRNRLRGFLSALSMFLGVCGIVGVALIRGLATDVLIASEEQQNGRAPTYSATISVRNTTDALDYLDTRLTQLAPHLSDTSALEVTSTVLLATAKAPANAPGEAIQVVWSSGQIDAVRRVPILAVRDATVRSTSGLLINRALADTHHLHPGDRAAIRIARDSTPVTTVVDGVVDDAVDSPRAYGRLEAIRLLHDPSSLESATVVVHSSDLSQAQIERWVRDAAHDSDALVESFQRTDSTERVREQLDQLEALFGVVGLSLLLVAALGLLNIGLATVDQRSRELALRRAVGARRRDVAMLVLGSAVALSLPVAAMATCAALIASEIVLPLALGASSTLETPPFPWEAIAVAVTAAVSTSVLGALAPALKATRIPIADALRA